MYASKYAIIAQGPWAVDILAPWGAETIEIKQYQCHPFCDG